MTELITNTRGENMDAAVPTGEGLTKLDIGSAHIARPVFQRPSWPNTLVLVLGLQIAHMSSSALRQRFRIVSKESSAVRTRRDRKVLFGKDVQPSHLRNQWNRTRRKCTQSEADFGPFVVNLLVSGDEIP